MFNLITPSERGVSRVLWMFIALSLLVRAFVWPGIHELRDGDELAYAGGSLQLLEGNLPGIHYAPAGPQTWIGWSYTAVLTAKHLIAPQSDMHNPLALRPFVA